MRRNVGVDKGAPFVRALIFASQRTKCDDEWRDLLTSNNNKCHSLLAHHRLMPSIYFLTLLHFVCVCISQCVCVCLIVRLALRYPAIRLWTSVHYVLLRGRVLLHQRVAVSRS